jgi:uncharacterized membrane protein YfcA
MFITSRPTIGPLQNSGGAKGNLLPPSGDPGSSAKGEISLENIVKLMPGDIVSAYIAGQALPPKQFLGLEWHTIVFVTCLVGCFALRALTSLHPDSTADKPRRNWLLALVTTFAFVIWAHAVSPDGKGPLFPEFSGGYAGFVALIFGIFAPLSVPAKRPTG